MAQTIKLKRSSVSGNTPSTSDLELGEVAINTYDGKMFIKKNDGSDSIVEIGGGSGTVTEAFKTIAVSGQSSVVADSATDTLTLVAGSNMTITTNASGDTVTFASSGGGGTQNVFSTFAVSGQSSVVADSTTDTLTFVAGTGITLTTDASNDEITITNSATGANAFGNIAVSGQSTVAADSTNDTVTFVAGSNMTITTNASGDSITFASSGGGGGTVVSGTFTASAGSPSTLDTYAYDSAELVFEYTVFIKNGSDYQTQKLLVMRDGTTVDSTQYAVMDSNDPLVQLDATISGSNLLLRATPETGVNGSTIYRLKREVI